MKARSWVVSEPWRHLPDRLESKAPQGPASFESEHSVSSATQLIGQGRSNAWMELGPQPLQRKQIGTLSGRPPLKHNIGCGVAGTEPFLSALGTSPLHN